jgi:hypothetical protein
MQADDKATEDVRENKEKEKDFEQEETGGTCFPFFCWLRNTKTKTKTSKANILI